MDEITFGNHDRRRTSMYAAVSGKRGVEAIYIQVTNAWDLQQCEIELTLPEAKELADFLLEHAQEKARP